MQRELTEYLVQRKEYISAKFILNGSNGFKTSVVGRMFWERYLPRMKSSWLIFQNFQMDWQKRGRKFTHFPCCQCTHSWINWVVNRCLSSAEYCLMYYGYLESWWPSIDFLSPDTVFQILVYWSDLYARQGDPLLVPRNIRRGQSGAANGLFLFAKYMVQLAFLRFAIESVRNLLWEEPLRQNVCSTQRD